MELELAYKDCRIQMKGFIGEDISGRKNNKQKARGEQIQGILRTSGYWTALATVRTAGREGLVVH